MYIYDRVDIYRFKYMYVNISINSWEVPLPIM